MNSHQFPVLIRAKLFNHVDGNTGIILGQRSDIAPRVQVQSLVKDSEAELSGLVRPGDIILQVNDHDLSRCSFEEAVDVFKQLPVDKMVRLVLRAPFGYTTRLETSFGDDGTPRTFRITERIYTNSGSNHDTVISCKANGPSLLNLQDPPKW